MYDNSCGEIRAVNQGRQDFIYRKNENYCLKKYPDISDAVACCCIRFINADISKRRARKETTEIKNTEWCPIFYDTDDGFATHETDTRSWPRNKKRSLHRIEWNHIQNWLQHKYVHIECVFRHITQRNVSDGWKKHIFASIKLNSSLHEKRANFQTKTLFKTQTHWLSFWVAYYGWQIAFN